MPASDNSRETANRFITAAREQGFSSEDIFAKLQEHGLLPGTEPKEGVLGGKSFLEASAEANEKSAASEIVKQASLAAKSDEAKRLSDAGALIGVDAAEVEAGPSTEGRTADIPELHDRDPGVSLPLLGPRAPSINTGDLRQFGDTVLTGAAAGYSALGNAGARIAQDLLPAGEAQATIARRIISTARSLIEEDNPNVADLTADIPVGGLDAEERGFLETIGALFEPGENIGQASHVAQDEFVNNSNTTAGRAARRAFLFGGELAADIPLALGVTATAARAISSTGRGLARLGGGAIEAGLSHRSATMQARAGKLINEAVGEALAEEVRPLAVSASRAATRKNVLDTAAEMGRKEGRVLQKEIQAEWEEALDVVTKEIDGEILDSSVAARNELSEAEAAYREAIEAAGLKPGDEASLLEDAAEMADEARRVADEMERFPFAPDRTIKPRDLADEVIDRAQAERQLEREFPFAPRLAAGVDRVAEKSGFGPTREAFRLKAQEIPRRLQKKRVELRSRLHRQMKPAADEWQRRMDLATPEEWGEMGRRVFLGEGHLVDPDFRRIVQKGVRDQFAVNKNPGVVDEAFGAPIPKSKAGDASNLRSVMMRGDAKSAGHAALRYLGDHFRTLVLPEITLPGAPRVHEFMPGAIGREFKDPVMRRFWEREFPGLIEGYKGNVNEEMAQLSRHSVRNANAISLASKRSGIPLKKLRGMIDEARRSGDLASIADGYEGVQRDALLRLSDPEGSLATSLSDLDAFSRRLVDDNMILGRKAGATEAQIKAAWDLTDKIKDNVGSYLHLSHAKYLDSDWLSRIENSDAFATLHNDIMKANPGMDKMEAWAQVYQVAERNPEGLGGFFRGGVTRGKKWGELVARKEVPDSARAVMGKVADFETNYSRGYNLLVHDIERTAFNRRVVDRGLELGMFTPADSPPPTPRAVKMSFNPGLDDPVWVPREVAEWWKMVNQPGAMGWGDGLFMAGLRRASGGTKLGKVVASTGAINRNFLSGGGGFMTANGFVFSPISSAKAGVKVGRALAESGAEQVAPRTAARVMDEILDNPARLNPLHAEAIKDGIMAQGVSVGDIDTYMANVRGQASGDFASGVGKRSDSFIREQKNVLSAVVKGAQEFGTAVGRLYRFGFQSGDDVWKMIGREVADDEFKWAMQGLSDENLDAFREIYQVPSTVSNEEMSRAAATIRIKDTMSQYDHAPRIAKLLSRNVLAGPFTTFQFEMPRNLANIFRHAGRDMQMARKLGVFTPEGARFEALAFKKMAGVSSWLVGRRTLISQLNHSNGFDKGELDDLRDFVYTYDKYGQFVVEKVDDEGNIYYTNFSDLDVYNQVDAQIQNVLTNGFSPEAFQEAIKELDDTYLGMELVAKYIFERIVDRQLQGGGWLQALPITSGVLGEPGGALRRGSEDFSISNPQASAAESALGTTDDPNTVLPATGGLSQLNRTFGPGDLVLAERLLRAHEVTVPFTGGKKLDNTFDFNFADEVSAFYGMRGRVTNIDNTLTGMARIFSKDIQDLKRTDQTKTDHVDRRFTLLSERLEKMVGVALRYRSKSEVRAALKKANMREELRDRLVRGGSLQYKDFQ